MLGGLEGETREHRDVTTDKDWCIILINHFIPCLISSLTSWQQYWLGWWNSLFTLTVSMPLWKVLLHWQMPDLVFGLRKKTTALLKASFNLGLSVGREGKLLFRCESPGKGGREGWMLGGPRDIFFLVFFFHPIPFPSMSTPNKTGLKLMGKAAISKLG